ncbi:MAG TPA: tRNA (N6-isopentenyl adenosine(37)-C2)-methylthiotransferase MiaB [Chloroflexia bacterium]|nr:tRNA (N6-isopentenyl adenosine(37)-C2)-methylthiotransferase MiaB [Chloroflexia bacterium]
MPNLKNEQKNYLIWTVGCQMNVADSNYVAAALKGRGYAEVEDIESADVVVLNSCVVRQAAEDRIVGKLGEVARLKKDRPGLFLALTGCMVTEDQTTLRRRFPMVDMFFKPSAVQDFLVGLPENSAPDLGEYGVALALEGLLPTAQAGGIAAYIPIIYGCNKTCTYCIVPFRRGKERSRTIADIAAEVERLVSQGVREVTLLGQNVDTYGHDLPERTDLAALLERLNDIEDLWRIRFLTSHPKDMAQNLVEAVARLPKAMEHINLPVQAGDDEIIKRMKRRYTLRYYRDLIRRIRETIPDVTLATDIIVGFPGETHDQFMHTMDLLEEIRFDKVHVAAYSPRPGTVAAEWEDDVPHEEKMVRLHAVEKLQERIGRELNEKHLGTEMEVLVEGVERGRWTGRTRGNKIVFFPVDSLKTDRTGQMVRVRVEEAGPWSMQGTLVREVHEAPQALRALLNAQSRRVTLPLTPVASAASQRSAAIPPAAGN